MPPKKKNYQVKEVEVKEQQLVKEENPTVKFHQEIDSIKEEFARKITGPRFVGGIKHFSKHDLSQLELSQLKLSSAIKDVALKEVEINKFLTEAKEKVEKLNKELENCKSLYVEKLKNFKELSEEIEKTYKVSMKSVSYDDSDGRIFESFEVKKTAESHVHDEKCEH